MAITWKVINTQYEVNGSKGTNQIYRLQWECYDIERVGDIDHIGKRWGSISIPEPSGSFIAFDSVTRDNCITWAKAALGSDIIAEIEADCVAQVTKSKSAGKKRGTPW